MHLNCTDSSLASHCFCNPSFLLDQHLTKEEALLSVSTANTTTTTNTIDDSIACHEYRRDKRILQTKTPITDPALTHGR